MSIENPVIFYPFLLLKKMEKALTKPIEKEEWYVHLVEQCEAIIKEHSFISRWTLIEGYHKLGKRILEDEPKIKQGGSTLRETLTLVSKHLGKSERTFYRAVEFAKKYPDLDLLPEGKDTSWHKVCNKYLSGPKQESETLECSHNGEFDFYLKCLKCHKFVQKTEEEVRQFFK